MDAPRPTQGRLKTRKNTKKDVVFYRSPDGHTTAEKLPRGALKTAPRRARTGSRRSQDAPRPPKSASRRRPDRPKTAPRPLQDRPKNAQERLKTRKNKHVCDISQGGQQIAQVRRRSAQLARLSSLIFDNLTSDLTVSQPQRSLKTPRRRHKTAPGRLKTVPRTPRGA